MTQYILAILALSALCVSWVFVQRWCADDGDELPCGSCSAKERGCVPQDRPGGGGGASCQAHSEPSHGGLHEQQ